MDQVNTLFDMFALYFDRRFFELQEFIYHFNKTMTVVNRNFQSIDLQHKKYNFEQLSSYKQRREERRLSEELREHIKQMQDIN